MASISIMPSEIPRLKTSCGVVPEFGSLLFCHWGVEIFVLASTQWKHFDTNASQQFDGVDYLLNDWSSAVLARNILFILLCVQLPKNAEERKKWLSAMWAVWYSHELYPQHQKILNDGLKLLLKYSESLDVWACAENPLRSIVRFFSPDVLTEICQVWKSWLEWHVSVKHMQSSRRKFIKEFEHCCGTSKELASTCVRDVMSVRGDSHEMLATKVDSRIPEVLSYLASGNSYAESVFRTDLPTTPTTANLTLYESEAGEYTLFYASVPFLSYFHTVDFSPKAMRGVSVGKSACDSMLVQSESFESHPLLANSVQQFSMWIQSSHAVLSQEKSTIIFTFSNQDALALYNKQNGNQFDVIFSSNLMDHLGLPNVVLSALPLLKFEGLLYTATMLYKHTDMTCLEDVLQMCFGFDCKLLPVILGVRCINHEGKGYASPVMIEPTPVTEQMQRFLVWQKVSGQLMMISKLPSFQRGSVTEGLVNSFMASTLPLMSTNGITNVDHMLMIRSNCIETAMHVLQTFMSSVNASSDYHFCEPLCAGVMFTLKSFLSGLQTQALLHNLHMHFTVDEVSCPICRQSPIEEYIGLFCAQVSLPLSAPSQPHFMALIHPYPSLKGEDGQSLGLHEKDIHVIDCFDGMVQGKQILLKFFAPKVFAKNNLNVTIACSNVFKGPKTGLALLATTNIRSMQIDFVHYSYSGTAALHHSGSADHGFGDLISNMYTGNSVVSEIALSDSMFDSLALSSLKTSRISSSEIQLTCGTLEFNLKFVYPVDYNGINIKLSRARRTVKIICPRLIHLFDEETPIFITYPDHQLSLPPQDVDKEILSYHFALQLVSGAKVMKSANGVEPSFQFDPNKDPLFRVKQILSDFLEFKDTVDFCLISNGKTLCGQIFVNKRMFDYEHRAPVVDLAFCFPEEHSKPLKIRHSKSRKNIPVNDTDCGELKRVLLYFAKQTKCDCKSASANSIYYDLVKGGVDQHFTRAVVFYLYGDPENQILRGLALAGTSTPLQSRTVCSFCNKSGDLKTCKQCGEARYCDRECQVKHWPRHKTRCKKSAKAKKI